MASFDFAPLTRRYAQDERCMKRCMNPPTVRPEPFDKLRTGVSGAKSKDAISKDAI